MIRDQLIALLVTSVVTCMLAIVLLVAIRRRDWVHVTFFTFLLSIMLCLFVMVVDQING